MDALCGMVHTMAVEVFNINNYLIEAATFNPDAAVTATHSITYAINSAPKDKVFSQRISRYTISGGRLPFLALQEITMISVVGKSSNTPILLNSDSRLFMVCSGKLDSQQKIIANRQRLFAITA